MTAQVDGVAARPAADQADVGRVGRQQPLAQPLMRTASSSSASPSPANSLSSGSSTPGRARWPSVIACEQVGKAAQARAQRRTLDNS